MSFHFKLICVICYAPRYIKYFHAIFRALYLLASKPHEFPRYRPHTALSTRPKYLPPFFCDSHLTVRS
jgi:hypothetical protein